MNRDFDQWLSTFRDSIADWKYYTDFNKVYKNVRSINIELNILNSLINSKDIENDFINLLAKYPEVLRVIPILIAKRESEVKINDVSGLLVFNFTKMNYNAKDYAVFMRNTGLFDLLENNIISDLTDYVKGVEVGLDSNARKNRTGKGMENLVEGFLIRGGLKKGITYFPQMKSSEIKKYFNIDITNVVVEGKADKTFDFVVKNQHKIFAIEVNFYGSGGSKLNETARSYKMIATESRNIPNFEFIWITDGNGWLDAKNNLAETFNVMDNLFNINDLDSGLLNELLSK